MPFSFPWRLGAVLLAVVVVAAVAAWWFSRTPVLPKDALTLLRERGTITIGVRTNAAPFSSIDGSGIYSGYEPDIGRALAGALKVQPKFVAVDATTANKFLARGLIDIAILPQDVSEMHDPAVRSIEPGYFASGLNAVTLAGHRLGDWEDLKGANVCGLASDQGAERMVKEFGAKYLGFPDLQSALQALSAERCTALVNDEVSLASAIASAGRQYSMNLETMDSMPWSIASRASDKQLGDWIANQIVTWHKTGFLADRAAAWNLPPNPYLSEMRAYHANR